MCKKCAQPVENKWEKYVQSFPPHARKSTDFDTPPKNPHIFPSSMPNSSTAKSHIVHSHILQINRGGL